jgi:Uma2 family endonuclease
MTLVDPKVWTYNDYLQLPDDGKRYEIIDGVVYMCPSPLPIHQTVSKRLQHFLYQLELDGKGYAFSAPLDLLMPGCTPVQPDLIFLQREQFSLIREKNVVGVPHLIVEILSPSNASLDRVTKLRKYAANGVSLYLIADPCDQILQVFELSGSHYRLQEALTAGDSWEFMGSTLDVAALFAALLP